MAIRVALQHRTTYRFDRHVNLSPHELRLRPAPHCRTPILGYSLNVTPEKYFLNWQQDPYGNWVARLVFTEPARALDIVVDLTADMTVTNPFDFFVEPYAEHYPFTYAPALAKELIPFLETAPLGPRLAAWVERFRAVDRARTKRRSTCWCASTSSSSPRSSISSGWSRACRRPRRRWRRRCGSCRDSGWLLVQILRHLGVAARFASGYLIQLVADVKPLDGPAGPDRDFTDLHAWAEAYLPGAGWIGFDPTSGLLAGEGHLPLACSADPGNAAPVIGYTDPCDVDFSFCDERHARPRGSARHAAVQRRAVGGDRRARPPRRRRPRAARRAAHAGRRADVRLDRRHGRARVELHRAVAEEARARRNAAASPRGTLRVGRLPAPGPGQVVSGRAVAALGARRLLAHRRQAAVARPGAAAPTRARRAAPTSRPRSDSPTTLAAGLGLDPAFVITAYEDVPQLLGAESALPANVDPLRADLAEPTERARLARLLQQGLDRPAGFVLPLRAAARRSVGGAEWHSSPWPLRRERLYALAGRFAARPAAAAGIAAGGAARRRRSRTRRSIRSRRAASCRTRAAALAARAKPRTKGAAVAPKDVVKTALCVEVRGGHLHVFMPPLPRLEDYVALLAAVEAAAKAVGLPVAIEGYTPPRDPRVRVLNVTPDPGVIEVNIHPASSWDELIATTEILYEEARQSRLGTEKFMLDGRHTGTGGGNHVTLGGATPADSPLLRRPDLLQSLHHVLAEPSGAVVPLLRARSSARPARRRASTRRATTGSTSSRSRSSR